MNIDMQALADATVTDLDRNEVRLGDFWSERPRVVLFLRHFG